MTPDDVPFALDGAPAEAVAPVPSDVGRIGRAGLWSVLAYATASLSTFVTSIIVARALGDELFGRYGLWVYLQRLIPTLLVFGAPRAITVVVAELVGGGREGEARAVLRSTARLHAALIPAAAIIAGVVATVAEGSALLGLAVGLGVAVTGAMLDLESVLSALSRFRDLAVAAAIGAVAQLALAFAGLALGFGWPAFVTLYVAASAVAIAAQLTRAHRAVRPFPRVDLTAVVKKRYTELVWIIGFAVIANEVLWGPIELLFLRTLRPAEDLGQYSAALRLASLPALLPLMFARVLVPEFSRLKGAGDDASMQRAFPEVCTMLLAVAAPVALGGAALAEPLLTTLFGAAYLPAAGATVVLFCGSAINALVGPASTAVMIGPRPRLLIEVGVVTGILLLVGDALLVPALGPLGAAIANVSVQAISVVAGLWFAWTRMGLRYPIGKGLVIIAMAAAAALAARVVAARFDADPIALGAGIATGGAVYLGLMMATGTVDLRRIVGNLRSG